ncbi:hypothetical protein M422DRAFT_26111 [Sphaerobolus stellatus SS14]|nr:hypothetical protein M422DRAFT_26111 [Sphaerobolus stellatus SS14]
MARAGLVFTVVLSLLIAISHSQNMSSIPAKILIFSRTVDFRHDSIPTAITALKQQGSSHNIEFDNTEDQTLFTDTNLSQYDAIIFLSNTGEVLDEFGVQALHNWVNAGGNFVGIHAASDAMRNNTFFQNELGAHFRDHPELQNATVTVVNASHPSTSMLPARWEVMDEMYHFKSDPRSVGAVVLLSADSSTFVDTTEPDPEEGSPSPKAWYQERGAGADGNATGPIGRSWYTSLGHLNETWQDPTFMAHVMGGITWALNSNTTRAFDANAKVGNPAANALTGTGSSASSTGATSSSSQTTGSNSAKSTTVGKTALGMGTLFAATITFGF